MKHKLLSKSLLMAVGLFVGASTAWGAEITETYDFGAFITANGAPNLTISGDDIAQSGTSAKVGNVKVINDPTIGGQTLNLNGRFAVDYQYNAGSQIRFMWRSNTPVKYQHGLAGNWNNKGTADPQGAARFSVLNLKAGDKITFTYAIQSGKNANPYTCRANMISVGETPVAVDAALASGTQYTMSADGNLDLYFTNNNFAISKIVIVTEGEETMGAPTISVTSAFDGEREVTITPGVGDGGTLASGTYYTLDGSDPTSSSTAYTEPFIIDATTTVKAVSYLGSKIGTIAELVVEAGSIVELNDAFLTHSGNGVYTISSDQSSVIGVPTATIHYQIDGGAEKTSKETSVSVNITNDGTITYWLTADGYQSMEPANETVYAATAYAYTTTVDFCTSNQNDWALKGDEVTVEGDDSHTYYKYCDQNSTIVNDGLLATTFSNDASTWRIQRYYGGTLTYKNTEYIALKNLEANQIVQIKCNSVPSVVANLSIVPASTYTGTYTYIATEDGDVIFSLKNNTVISKIYLCSSTVPVTVSKYGYATFVSPYALDYTSATDIEAYTVQVTKPGVATLTQVYEVPANAPVLLYVEGATKEITENIPVIASAAALENNDLVAGTGSTAIDGDLVLGLDENNVVGFYKYTGTLATDKAYLPKEVVKSAPAIYFSFEDETEVTGVFNLRVEEKANAAFDLTGRRANGKGLMIQNGKVVLVK